MYLFIYTSRQKFARQNGALFQSDIDAKFNGFSFNYYLPIMDGPLDA